jgi:hypothetical protein
MLLAFAVALGSRVANAEPQLFVELDYQADAALACPSETAFKAMVSEQLGYDPFRASAEEKVVARTRSSERGLRGVIEWHDASGKPRGERELGSEGSDCAALVRSMSFAIVVQIQLLAQEADGSAGVPLEERSTVNPSPAERVSSPSDTTSGEARDAGRDGSAHPRDEEPSWQFLLGIGPTLAFGLAPRTLVEGRAFFGLRRGKLAFELGGEASLMSEHETGDGTGFEQQVLAGSIAGCWLFGRLSGCLVSKVGRLQVRGFGVDAPNSDSGTLWLVGPRLTLLQGFGGPWFGSLRVEALASLHTWDVTLDQEEVWKTPLFSLSFGGDLGLSFQ